MTNTTKTSKKFTKKTLGLILSLVFILGTVFCVPLSASAAEKNTKNQVIYTDPDYPNETTDTYIAVSQFVSGVTKTSQIKNIKTNSSEVFYKVLSDYSPVHSGPVILVRAMPSFRGTTKISFQVGKKTYSTNFTVKSYTNPAATLKIGGKNVAKYANNRTEFMFNSIGTNGTCNLEIKAKSGWVVQQITAYGKNHMFCNVTVGSQSATQSLNDFEYLKVIFKNKQTGAYITLGCHNQGYNGTK